MKACCKNQIVITSDESDPGDIPLSESDKTEKENNENIHARQQEYNNNSTVTVAVRFGNQRAKISFNKRPRIYQPITVPRYRGIPATSGHMRTCCSIAIGSRSPVYIRRSGA